ncbi:MAG: hypothetical protein HY821_24805 [Acidobacteria bacterium]|nr:hypothetical protein [Acidobacteriota bacterium]
MRCFLLTLVATSTLWGFEGHPSLHSPLTVVVDSEKPLPSAALQELQAELDLLMKQGNRQVEWKTLGEMQSGTEASDLVVVRFRGNCRMEPFPVPLDERGPLALTHTADGEVLPFSEVLCDRVQAAARKAMHGGQFREGDKLMGRAMARVLAHEIWHIAGNTHGHGDEGVARRGLSGRQLIADRLQFAPSDAALLTRKTVR